LQLQETIANQIWLTSRVTWREEAVVRSTMPDGFLLRRPALDRADILEVCSRRPKSWVYFCSTQAPLIETVILWEAAFTAYNSTAPLERLRLPP
jgi:hypothetical protein